MVDKLIAGLAVAAVVGALRHALRNTALGDYLPRSGRGSIALVVGTFAIVFGVALLADKHDGRSNRGAVYGGGDRVETSQAPRPPSPPTDVTPPASPTAIRASVRGRAVALNWTGSGSPDVDHYSVFRNDELVGEPTEASFTDRLADAGIGHFVYGVDAVDGAGNASGRVEKTVSLPCLPTTPQPLNGDGPYEPNGQSAKAWPLVDGREHLAFLETGDDRDWYLVCTGPSRRVLKVRVRFRSHRGCYADVRLLGPNNDQDRVDKFQLTPSGDTTISNWVKPDSLYYVEVGAQPDECESTDAPFGYFVTIGPADALQD